jgi:hypothetical protein
MKIIPKCADCIHCEVCKYAESVLSIIDEIGALHLPENYSFENPIMLELSCDQYRPDYD